MLGLVFLCGCGGDGGAASGNPTLPGQALALALDLDEITPATDVVALTGESVDFAVRLGPEHNLDRTRFRWTLDGAHLAGDGSEATVATGKLDAGPHEVAVKVSEDGCEATASWFLHVESVAPRDRPPLILQALPAGGRTARQGETSRFSVLAADVDASDRDRLRYRWTVDGSEIPADGREAEVPTGLLDLGAHEVVVRVTDAARAEGRPSEVVWEPSEVAWKLEVVPPEALSAPYFTGAWPRGNVRIGVGGALRFEVRAESPNPEDKVAYCWEVDGVRQDQDEPFFLYRPSLTEETEEDVSGGGENVRTAHSVSCRLVRGSDAPGVEHTRWEGRAVGWTVRVAGSGDERGAGGTTWPASAAGAPEFVASSVEAPPFLVPGEPRVFRAEAVDTDGDLLTYRWYAGGRLLMADGPVLSYVPGTELPGQDLDFPRTGSLARITVVVDDGFAPSGPVFRSWDVPVSVPQYLALSPASGSVILDNGDAGTSSTGTWKASGASGYYGANSVYSKASDTSYTYNFSVPSSGSYDVLLWWTSWSSRSSAVPVTIVHQDGTDRVTVNQQADGGKWNRVGTYNFSSAGRITITSAGGVYSTCADAACLSPVSTSPPPGDDPPPASGEIIIDNGDAGTSSEGTWSRSSAPNPYGGTSLYAKGSGYYSFTRALSEPASYDVYAWWTEWPSRDPNASYEITHSSGTSTVKKDQRTSGGKWNLLGTYSFSSQVKVVVRATSSYSVCADAVRFVPAGSAPPPPPPPPPASGEIIIDNGDAGTSSEGTWSRSSAPNPYGGTSLYAKGSGYYSFTRALSEPASYDVYAWWTEWPSRDPNAPYEITHSSGTSTVKRDQRTSGGKWNLLGTYSFSSQVKVVVRATSSYSVCADAVRFVPAGSAPPPPPPDGSDIIVDNGGPGTSSDGTWSVSGGPNPYGANSLYARDRGYYRYDVALPASGTYGVYVWYTEWSSRDDRVPYEVLHASGTTTVYLDQRSGGGAWRSLGDHTFGATAQITIRVVDGDSVCADAVRLVPGGGAPAPDPDPAPTPDPGPESPAIFNLAAFALTPDSARVSWETNFLGNSVVKYGLTTSLSSGTRSISGERSMHSVVISGLSENRQYYVRASTSGSGTSKTSSVVSFRTPDSTPSFSVVSTHPRIYFNRSEIDAIKARVTQSPFSTWWSSLISFSSRQVDKSISTVIDEDPDYTIGVAFAGLIGNQSRFRTHAIDVAMRVASLSSTSDDKELRKRVQLILPAYDWLYDYLSSGERSTLRSSLVSLATKLEGFVRSDEFAAGHSNGNQSWAFLAALAVYGESSSASGIISRALARYQDGFWPFWREHASEGGGSFKGAWYTMVASEFNSNVFAAWESATGQDLYSSQSWFAGLADLYLYALRGDMSWVQYGDVIVLVDQGVSEVDRYLLMQIASHYGDREAQWLADKIRARVPVWGPRAVWEILWYDPSVSPRAPAMARSRLFKGCGMAYMLESWSDKSVRAHFRAVPHYMNTHTHLDQCSFSLFYEKGLAIDSGIYDSYDSSHWRNYYSRSIAHNTILVDNPSEVFRRYGDVVSADGGQRFLSSPDVPYPYPRQIDDLVVRDDFNLGGIEAYEDTDLYTYSLGNGTPAYSPQKLSGFYRHFLWIKSLSGWSHPVVLVFDEVESTSSSYKKTYLLHTEKKPSVSGTLVTMTNGAGMLYQRTVFPKSPTIKRVGGTGMEYWVDGKNYPPNRSPKSGEEAGAWRVEVSPSTARTRDEFLHALYATGAGSSAPPSVRSIDTGSLKGLETQGVVVLFATRLRAVSSATYSLTGARRNLLFGLNPGRRYQVLVNGSVDATYTATVNGSLDFTNSSGGEIKVVLK